jgi:TorA maturation chaperone TorD
MSRDLADLANRRAGIAALLGLLLLEEPGPAIAPLVAGSPSLAPLADGDAAHAVEYERLFLRGVPLRQSAFCDPGQEHAVLAEVVDRFDEVGYDEHRTGRWRVAGADHLGLLLRCHATLCLEEAAAWTADAPDSAVRAVEAERSLLAAHVSGWAPVALDAARHLAGDGAYRAVIDAADAFLCEEHDRLRPRPLVDETSAPPPLPEALGPARLSRLLLAPGTCGTWLDTSDIATAAGAIGAPWRPSDTRSMLRNLIEAAGEPGELTLLLQPIRRALQSAAERYCGRLAADLGNAATWAEWRARVEQMTALLDRVAEDGVLRPLVASVSEQLTITGIDAGRVADLIDTVVAQLRAAGLHVERSSWPGPVPSAVRPDRGR